MNEKIIRLLSAVALNLDKELTWTLVELIREIQCPRCVGMGYVTTEKNKNCEMCLGTGQKYHKLLVNFVDQKPGVVINMAKDMINDLKKALNKPKEKLAYRRGPK